VLELFGHDIFVGQVAVKQPHVTGESIERAKKPHSQAPSTGKYEFEIISGTAILIGIIRMLARASIYKRPATALRLSSRPCGGVIPASMAALF
jgi:hypothetical protein